MGKRSSVFLLLAAFGVFLSSNLLAATKMPSFSLESVQDGNVFDSKLLEGKVLLLTFFATWCPPCSEEVPVLKQLHRDLAGAGFSVVGLSVDQQSPQNVADFVKRKKINYPVLFAKAKTTMDFGGVYGIPVAFLVNKSGNVVKRYSGYVQHDILEKDIRILLN